jgi:hypothetical protein
LLGKTISQYKNCGIAIMDIAKLDKLGLKTKCVIGEHRALVWLPSWLEDIRKE